MGPFIVVACLVVSAFGIIAPLLSAARHGSRGLARAFLGWLGAPLVLGWVMLYVGVTEVGWSGGGRFYSACIAAGTVGVVLVGIGWWTALRSQRAGGLCSRCDYPVDRLPRCPECGQDRPAGGWW